MNTFAIFLRGVMPTGKNKVPMPALKAALEKKGFQEVRTYIQSGNVLLKTNKDALEVAKAVGALIKKEFGGDIPCVAKTPKQLQHILKKNPFFLQDPAKTYFTLLYDLPAKDTVAELRALDFTPDKGQIVDDVIYTHYNTKLSDSKFNNNFYEKRLGLKATTRNFNTLTKVAQLILE